MRMPIARVLLASSAALVLACLAKVAEAEQRPLHEVAYAHGHRTGLKGNHVEAHPGLRCGHCWHRDPDDVVQDGWVIGRDPDPSIRSEILRDSVGGGPG